MDANCWRRLESCSYHSICHLFAVRNRCEIVSKELIHRFVSMWVGKPFAPFVVTPAENECDAEPTADTGEVGAESDSAINNECRVDGNYLFSMVLSPAALLAQQHKPKQSFIVLAELLTALIKNDLMTISFINKQCVKLLRQEWEQVSAFDLHEPCAMSNCRMNFTVENEQKKKLLAKYVLFDFRCRWLWITWPLPFKRSSTIANGSWPMIMRRCFWKCWPIWYETWTIFPFESRHSFHFYNYSLFHWLFDIIFYLDESVHTIRNRYNYMLSSLENVMVLLLYKCFVW